MGYFSIGSKAAMGVAAGAGIGYAGYKATGAGYTNAGMGTMGVGTALGVGSLALGKRGISKHATARAFERVARETARASGKLSGQASRRFAGAKMAGVIGVGAAGYRCL
jgi:hypothetical protein